MSLFAKKKYAEFGELLYECSLFSKGLSSEQQVETEMLSAFNTFLESEYRFTKQEKTMFNAIYSFYWTKLCEKILSPTFSMNDRDYLYPMLLEDVRKEHLELPKNPSLLYVAYTYDDVWREFANNNKPDFFNWYNVDYWWSLGNDNPPPIAVVFCKFALSLSKFFHKYFPKVEKDWYTKQIEHYLFGFRNHDAIMLNGVQRENL